MQKMYENELLGIHVHANIPPANQLIMEQHVNKINTLYENAYFPRTLQNTLWPDFTWTGTPGTHTHTHTHTQTHIYTHTTEVWS